MEIIELVNTHRIESSLLSKLFLILYIPMGIVCFTVRILISLQYILILNCLPKTWAIRRIFIRIYFSIVGLIITIGGKEHRRKETKLVVSNHVSCLDSLVIEAVEPLQRITTQADLPPILGWLFGFRNLNLRKSELVPVIQNMMEENSFACFPEEETTNGKAGLLKFSTWPIELNSETVQPVILYASRYSFASVNVNYMDSTVWSDIFWVLFLPFTHFHIGYLPVKDLPISDTESTFEQVRQDIAMVLKIKPSNLTAQDKRDFVKRYKIEQIQSKEESPRSEEPSPSQQTNNTMQIKRMVDQVKAVMPQVPSHVIKADIALTSSVDRTLANLLDGSLSFTPLTEEEQQKESNKKEEILVKATKSVFATSSNERHLSFQQRKERTMKNARMRYLDRHPDCEAI